MANLKSDAGFKGAFKKASFVSIILLLVCAILLSVAGAFQQPIRQASAINSVSLTAMGTDDDAEVQKDEIVSFTLKAKFSAGGSDLSGLVTFTDVLPEHMELLTGTQTVEGVDVDCNPNLSGNSLGTWAGSGSASGAASADAGDFTYDSATRTLKCYIKDMQGTGTDATSDASIKIYVKVTDDAYSLDPQVNLLYYINYATVNYASETALSNKVRFYSGASEAGEYTINYAWTGDTSAGGANEPPSGVTPPASVKYRKTDNTPASAFAIAPAMEHAGYSFEGWTIDESSAVDGVTLDEDGITWPSTVEGDEITIVGKWTKLESKFTVENTWIGWDSASSASSEADRPQLSDVTGGKATEQIVGTSVAVPKFPDSTKTSSDEADANDPYGTLYDSYKFLGYEFFATYTKDGVDTTTVLTVSAGEIAGGKFTPATQTSNGTLTKVTIQGKWERKSFSMTFSKGENWPDTLALDTFPGISGGTLNADGSEFSVTKKWGEKVQVPKSYSTEGAVFDAWSFDPSVDEVKAEATAECQTFKVPKEDVLVVGDFEKTYTLTSVDATFKVAGEEASKTSAQVQAGTYVTVSPSEVGDIKFDKYTYNSGLDPAGEASSLTDWQQAENKTATFLMPDEDVTITASMVMDVTFKIENGVWQDATADEKTLALPMQKNADNTWAGTLAESNVLTAVGDVTSATADFSYDQTSGHWENESAGTTAFPTEFLATDYFTTDASGNFSAGRQKEFTFAFNLLPDIVVPYKVSSLSTGYGKVAKQTTDGTEPTWVDEWTSDPFSPASTVENAAGTATAKAEVGHSFVMWAAEDNLAKSLSDQPTFSPSKEITESGKEIWVERTYVAFFATNTYNVEFKANGGTGEMASQEFVYDEPATLKSNTFTRASYEFAGWNTKADGSGTAYADEQQVEKLSAEQSATITLYAQWRQNKSTDATDETWVFGNDIWLSVAEAEDLLAKEASDQLTYVVDKSHAYALQKTNTSNETKNLTITKADISDVLAKIGDYEATLSTYNGASAKIGVHVYSKTEVQEKDNIAIVANNFRVSCENVEKWGLNKGTNLTSQGKQALINFAKAKAWNTSDVNVNFDVKITENKITSEPGVYNVTFEAENGKSFTVSVRVQATVFDRSSDDDEDFNPEDNPYPHPQPDSPKDPDPSTNTSDEILIYANDFAISLNEAEEIEGSGEVASDTVKEKLIRLSGAQAEWNSNKNDADVASAQSWIKAEKGVYVVKFTSEADTSGKTASVCVNAIVRETGGDNADVSVDERITANNVAVKKSDVPTFTNAQWIDLARAKAVKVSDITGGRNVDVTQVARQGEFAGSDVEVGDYASALKFATDAGTSAVVDARVFDEVEYDDPSDWASSYVQIAANNFLVSKKQVSDIGLDKPVSDMSSSAKTFLTDKARPSAWNTIDGTEIEPVLTDCKIEAQKGSYDVTFTAASADGTHTASVTVKARVTDEEAKSADETVEIFANNFFVSLDELKEKDLEETNGKASEKGEKNLIELALAKALRVEDLKSIEVKVKANAIKAKKGFYEVTFVATDPDDTSKTVETTVIATVLDTGTDDSDTAERIASNNFRISTNEASSILNGEAFESDNIVRLESAETSLNAGQKELIRLGNARAERTTDGASVDIAKVETTIEASKGKNYSTTFETAEGTSVKEVNVVVADNSSESAELKTRMTSNNIELTYDEAGELLAKEVSDIEEELIEKCDAYAYFTDTGVKTDVTSAKWNIKQKEGTYTATFYTEDEAEVTSTVTVGAKVVPAAAETTSENPLIPTALAKTGDEVWWLSIAFLLMAAFLAFFTNISKKGKHARSEKVAFKSPALVGAGALTIAMAIGLACFNLPSASAGSGDVTFDNITINKGAKLDINATHSVTAISNDKVVANETSSSEVSTTEATNVLAKFAGETYATDPIVTSLSNASLPNIEFVNTNKNYLQSVTKGYWLSDTSSTNGVKTQGWRNASNNAETVSKPAQGKAPDGTFFTPAPKWASTNYTKYSEGKNPLSTMTMTGFDVSKDTKLADCAWSSMTNVWDANSTAKVYCWGAKTTLTKTIYTGKEVYNNPWCIDDPSQGFYKTTVKQYTMSDTMTGYIAARVELFEGTENASSGAFLNNFDYYKTIKAGDVLLLNESSAYLTDVTGFKSENEEEPRQKYNIYFKAEEDAEITGYAQLQAEYAIGYISGSEATGAVKGQTVASGTHAVRPVYDLDSSSIAFFRSKTSSQTLATSSKLGKLPTRSAKSSDEVKAVVKSDDTKISWKPTNSNCSTDRDEGRTKSTKVQGTTIKVPWKSKTLTLKNVNTENANFVSALVQTADNKKYGVLANSEVSDITLTLSNLMSTSTIGDKITVSLYAEKANGEGISDAISAEPVTFQVEIVASASQTIEYDVNGGSGTVPSAQTGIAGETAKIASGNALTGTNGNAFDHWELTYVPFGETSETTMQCASNENIVIPDASGTITAKAAYAGHIVAEKNTNKSGPLIRLTFDTNETTDNFDAGFENATTGDKTKTTRHSEALPGEGFKLTSEMIPDDNKVVVNAKDGYVWLFAGWSTNKNCAVKDALDKDELAAKSVTLTEDTTYYAIWLKSYGFWVGRKGADATYENEVDFVKHDDNYISPTEILSDMTILHNSSDTAYSLTKLIWDVKYGQDIVRLYATYSGATGLNKYVEFRIMEVSGATGHDGDGSAITFMATHTLTDTSAMHTWTSNQGGWASVDCALRNNLKSGGWIYKKFDKNFTDNIKTVTKKYNAGNFEAAGKYSTVSDKLWVPSYKELYATGTYSHEAPTAEGATYKWCSDKKIDGWENNSCLVMNTRAAMASGSYSGTQWAERSPITDNWFASLVVNRDGAIYPADTATATRNIVPCFCF